ncbi:MAG: glucose-1-phosphate cytidylyltransferase [Roseburia sp.]
MKVVILAGGFGTRISEESYLKPKPMIEIGGQPILWHIMKYYSSYGFNEFIICAGYKQHVIKEYFANYYLHRSDITFDFTAKNSIHIHNNVAEPWKVTIVDTGLHTMTGGRIKRIRDYIKDEAFLLTYGDGVSDVPLDRLVEFHKKNKRTVTLTAVQPGGRFGVLDMDAGGTIKSFTEKKKEDGGWINGGYMVVESSIFERIDGDDTIFERIPLESCAKEGELDAYIHDGFWQCMDTMRDKELLENLWKSGTAPWVRWE